MNSGILRSCKCNGPWDTMRRAVQHNGFCVASEGTDIQAFYQGLTEKKQVYMGGWVGGCVCEGGKRAVNKDPTGKQSSKVGKTDNWGCL